MTALSLTVALVVAAAAAPPGLNEAGVRAATERRYCDASAIFVQVHGLTRDPLALYRGAETAFAAGDFLAAIRLYRTLLDNHPDFERATVVETRIAELLLRVRESGPGTACALPPRICGDWIMSAGEGCDDGNIVDGDGCDATCMPTGCGNGSVTGNEVCDDGNAENGDGCDANCTISACGNGAIGPSEACDDGNTVDGDGCDANCTLSACGNGVRAAGEACDDGNLENGDGCDSFCAIETPTRPFPWAIAGAGVGATVVGVVGIVVGTLPLLAHDAARRDVLAAEDLGAANPDVALQRATDAQAAQQQAQDDWNTWGLASLVAGSVATVAGIGLAVGAVVISQLPDETADQEAPPDGDGNAGNARVGGTDGTNAVSTPVTTTTKATTASAAPASPPGDGGTNDEAANPTGGPDAAHCARERSELAQCPAPADVDTLRDADPGSEASP